MDESGIRQVQASKARARACLHRLGSFLENLIQSGNAPEEKRRLKLEHVKKRAKRAKSYYQLSGRAVEGIDDPNLLPRLIQVTFNILEAIAKEEIPQDRDLDFLTEVLDQKKEPIRFHPDGDDPAEWVWDPYRPPDKLTTLFAKDLLEYMNLSARYGPEHGICDMEGCARLMMAGRGGKKFCSSECRRAFWSYDRKKEYYIERQAHSRHSGGRLKKQQQKGKRQHGSKLPNQGR